MKKDYGYTSIYLTLIISGLAIASCSSDEPVPAPAISISVAPESGNTTQTFTFDLGKSESNTGRGKKLYTRWDWNGDGIWDTPFTRMLVYTHRYYAPGTWKPKLEMSNLDGVTDTLTLTVPVERGYSPPDAVLKMIPETGHIYTSFLLDGSGTRDDEDSSNLLQYRWDFEGDGTWDTPFGDSARIRRTYPVTGSYKPAFQVRDPANLISTGRAQLFITLTDPRLSVSFRCDPDSVTTETEIRMDASASADLDNPGDPLLYRWDWDNDHIWDTGWLPEPVTNQIFTAEFFHYVRLQVMSSRGLQNEMVQKIRAWHRNRMPVGSFAVSTFGGNIYTDFRFDCWSTRDLEDSPSSMFYRWDFNGDGDWDTDYINSVITFHRFSEPGTYPAIMDVMDLNGGHDTLSKTIRISSGSNQTQVYNDARGLIYESYGTVLIGDQWWTTRNMKLYDPPRTGGVAYGDSLDFGYLYYPSVFEKICPPGWRVPSREDWDKLLANYPEDDLFDALIPGGDADFSASFGGICYGFGFDKTLTGLNRYGYYWSTSKPLDGSAVSNWVVTFDLANRKVLRGYRAASGVAMGVRCVKDR